MRRAVGKSSRRLAVVLALLAGCGKEPPPPQPPPAPAPVQDPEPEIPPMGEVTLPEGEIDTEEFPALDAPSETPELRWDFGKGKKYVYAFNQTITQVTVNVVAGERKVIRTRDRNGGTFEFAAREGDRARALMRIVAREASVDGRSLSKQEVGARKPRLYDCTIRSDGTAEEIRGKDPQIQEQARTFFLVLLPLQPGEQAGSAAHFTTRVDGRRKVRRWECVRLVTEFEMTPTSPTSRAQVRGRTVAYFAPREGFFVQAETVVAQGTRVKTRDKEGRWLTSAYDSVTVSTLKLKE